MRLPLYLVEALRSLRSSASISLAAVVTVLSAVFMLGIFVPVYLQVRAVVDDQRDKLNVRVFIDDNAPLDQVNALKTAIEADDNTKSVAFISKADALEIVREQVDPSVLAELPANPLPASFDVILNDPAKRQELVDSLAGHPALDTTGNPFSTGGETADKIIRGGNIIKWAGLGLFVVLLVASVFQIANTIRLSIFARRREVEVMKLVGATNWFIRWPFMIEGVICGIAGALISVGLLFAVKVAIVDTLFNLSDSPFVSGDDGAGIGFLPLSLILVAAGAVVGALGGGITLRRFLRV